MSALRSDLARLCVTHPGRSVLIVLGVLLAMPFVGNASYYWMAHDLVHNPSYMGCTTNAWWLPSSSVSMANKIGSILAGWLIDAGWISAALIAISTAGVLLEPTIVRLREEARRSAAPSPRNAPLSKKAQTAKVETPKAEPQKVEPSPTASIPSA